MNLPKFFFGMSDLSNHSRVSKSEKAWYRKTPEVEALLEVLRLPKSIRGLALRGREGPNCYRLFHGPKVEIGITQVS